MEQIVDKDIECIECGNHFKWEEIPEENKPSESSCICPHCNKEVWPIIPNKNIYSALAVAIIIFLLAIYSSFNWGTITTVLICALGVIGITIFQKIVFKNGNISTVKKNA